MKRLLLASLVVAGACAALAADPAPLLGNWHEDAKQGYFEVQGTFDGHVVVKFVCLKQSNLCFQSWAHIIGDKKFITVDSTLWEINRWDSTTLISRDEFPICQTNQLQVDFEAKSLVIFIQPKKVSPNAADICKGTKAEAQVLRYLKSGR
jgi:hypothetical protein